MWLNLGDSYAASSKGTGGKSNSTLNAKRDENGDLANDRKSQPWMDEPVHFDLAKSGLKPKDLIGIPWMVAFALRADGWYLRSEIIWHKRAPMPESVRDRPTKAHEQVFLLAKNANYFYDQEAIREPLSESTANDPRMKDMGRTYEGKGRGAYGEIGRANGSMESWSLNPNGRNKRSVWTLGPEQFPGSHFATMPTKLVEPCILAGTSAHGACANCGSPWERVVEKEAGITGAARGYHVDVPRPNGNQPPVAYAQAKVFRNSTQLAGSPKPSTTLGWQPTCTCGCDDVVPCTVLDPFAGSGTTLAVALKHGRRAIGCELNSDYIALIHDRISKSQPMLLEVTP